MFRIPFRSDFILRFIFEDVDGVPVSMKGVDVDFWLTTRTAAPPFSAFVRSRQAMNAQTLEDGSIIVRCFNARLMPGKLKAVINVHAQFDNEGSLSSHPHHHHHDHHNEPAPVPKSSEYITLSPNVPVELVDSTCINSSMNRFNPDEPIVVKAKFNISRPHLTKHVTMAEMERSIASAIQDFAGSFEPADDEDLQNIFSLFDLP